MKLSCYYKLNLVILCWNVSFLSHNMLLVFEKSLTLEFIFSLVGQRVHLGRAPNFLASQISQEREEGFLSYISSFPLLRVEKDAEVSRRGVNWGN